MVCAPRFCSWRRRCMRRLRVRSPEMPAGSRPGRTPPAYVTVSTRFWAESAAPVDLRRPVPAPSADDRVFLPFENGVVPGAGGNRADAGVGGVELLRPLAHLVPLLGLLRRPD